ncbi:MAG: hypothetical protein AB8I08_32480 [Sandaracinaceae bacterium]
MRRAMAMLTAALITSGCAAAQAPSLRIAVLPVQWATEDPLASDERVPLVEGLTATSGQTVLSPDSACADEACAQEAGLAADAERVVLASMAALGETALARVVVLDVELGTQEQTRQEVIPSLAPDTVQARLRALGEAVGEPFATPRETPWYEEAWLWTTLGAVVVGGVVATVLGVTLSQGDGPDFTVVPP